MTVPNAAEDAVAITIETLRDRILALIPVHMQILDMDCPWDLFDVPGFDCDDLGPTVFQAWAAFDEALEIHRQARPKPGV